MNHAEIIEKGALAIYFQSPTPWASSWPSHVDEGVRKICRRQYRAAYLATLDAIREPSEEILEIGCDAYALDEVIVFTQPLADAFRAMIDALKRGVAG